MATGTRFSLATVSKNSGTPFVALVLGDQAVRLERVAKHVTGLSESACATVLGLIESWDTNFEKLCSASALLAREGFDDPRWRDHVFMLSSLKFHAPLHPPSMFFAAVNYPRPERDRNRDPSVIRRPYMFEKSGRSIIGPYDDIIKPVGFDKIDWEVELALVIARGGRRIQAERAMDHVAGFMIANDITCRGFRQPGELPIAGPDWFGSKCHDTFAPLGPIFVPSAFVPDCRNLRLTLKVNGEIRQDGNSRDMVFSPEELIAHVSNQITLVSGDLFSTGTPEGFGAQSDRFLKVGDIVEAEIEGLGAQRNQLVAPPEES